jgi:hypothetical protein
MEYATYKAQGECNQALEGYRYRYFPISCANRTVSPWDPYTTTIAVFGEKRTVSSNRTPNYWARRKRGEWLPDNVFTSSRRSVSSFGHTSLTWTWQQGGCTNPVAFVWDQIEGLRMPNYMSQQAIAERATSAGADGELVTQIITECMANRQKGSSNYVESLAELDQVWSMIRDPLTNFRSFHVQFERSERYRRLVRLRKQAGQAVRPFTHVPRRMKGSLLGQLALLTTSEYLRYRYGVTPLVSDVKAAMGALKKNYQAAMSTEVHTARAKGQIQGQKLNDFTSSSAYLKTDWRNAITNTFSVRAKWCDQYATTPWNDLGLTYHNFIGAVWELTHFSFVVDWFANVGDFIYANLPRVGVTPLGGSYFMVDQIYNVWSFIGYTNLQPAVLIYTGALADGVIIDLNIKTRRVIDPQLRGTGLVIKSDFKLDNWTRAGDAFALAIQAARNIVF